MDKLDYEFLAFLVEQRVWGRPVAAQAAESWWTGHLGGGGAGWRTRIAQAEAAGWCEISTLHGRITGIEPLPTGILVARSFTAGDLEQAWSTITAAALQSVPAEAGTSAQIAAHTGYPELLVSAIMRTDQRLLV